MHALWAVTAAVILAGCADSQPYMRTLKQSNALRVDPANTLGADYVVSLRNLKDVGYDPDDKADRDRVALAALRDQCPAGRIVGETVINTGTYLLGNPSRTYALRIKYGAA